MPLSTMPIITVNHVQSEPALNWVIEHGQPGYPIVDVYMDVEGVVQKIMPAAIIYVDEFTVRVEFSQPQAGFATVLV